MSNPQWDIRRRGRAWRAGEAMSRFEMTPEKIEMVGGKLFDTDEQRITMLGLLLENMGIDAVVELGDAKVWRNAVDRLK